MKKTIPMIAALATIALGTLTAKAATVTTYDVTEPSIFGGGNSDIDYTKGSSTMDDVVVYIRGKNRSTGDTPHIGNEYGPFPLGSPSGVRTFGQEDWMIDVDPTGTNGRTLASTGFSYFFGFDTDPSEAVSMTWLDILSTFGAVGDNSYGDFDTANSAGVEIGPTGPGIYSKVGNSWNLSFGGVNPNVNGTYDNAIAIYNGTELLVEQSVRIIEGAGGDPAPEPVPEPSTVIGGIALAGLALRRAVRRNKK